MSVNRLILAMMWRLVWYRVVLGRCGGSSSMHGILFGWGMSALF
jgi:hypothetical protein